MNVIVTALIGIVAVTVLWCIETYTRIRKKSMKKITGKVIHGSEDGRKLGFPTANVELTEPLDLEYGVYASTFIVDRKTYKSVTHYGPRLVFNETKPQLEVHILDFTMNIYDKKVTVEIHEFLRRTIPFTTVNAMKKQIVQDCEDARKALATG